MDGVIKRLVRDKGFGFIRGADGVERFFHKREVPSSVAFDRLREGDPVRFDEEPGKAGKGPRARIVATA